MAMDQGVRWDLQLALIKVTAAAMFHCDAPNRETLSELREAIADYQLLFIEATAPQAVVPLTQRRRAVGVSRSGRVQRAKSTPK